jgi:hypothetical protein
MLPVSLNEICVPIPAQLKQHPVSRIKTSQTQTIKHHHRHNRCFNRLAVVFTEQPKDGWGLLKLESMKNQVFCDPSQKAGKFCQKETLKNKPTDMVLISVIMILIFGNVSG